MLNEIIDEHRETLDVENPRDFIDAYLISAKKESDGKFLVCKSFLRLLKFKISFI